MADHDELCPATIADGRWRARCECALIARVRADFDKVRVELMGRVAEVEKLRWLLDRAADERDAARAEAERLRSPEWEAEVRADERERIVAELEGPALESEAMYAHAEAVAARLVEVIVRQEYGLQQWHRATADVTYSLAQERDAARARTVEAEQKVIDAHREVALARAEVAALAEKLAKCTDDKVAERVAFGKERNALKAEVAALREEVAHAWAVANGEARR